MMDWMKKIKIGSIFQYNGIGEKYRITSYHSGAWFYVSVRYPDSTPCIFILDNMYLDSGWKIINPSVESIEDLFDAD